MGCGGSKTAEAPSKQHGANAEPEVHAYPKKNIKVQWEAMREKLPRSRSAEDVARRKELWGEWDPNGNGILSLAEVDKGLRDIGLRDLTDDLPTIEIGAFNAAKAEGTKRGNTNDKSDYIDRVEFRLLLVYVYDYFELWVAFDEIDSSDDHRVTLKEFKQAVPQLEKWGISVPDPDEEFKKIDTNNGGMLLFDEFARWAVAKNLDVDGEENIE